MVLYPEIHQPVNSEIFADNVRVILHSSVIVYASLTISQTITPALTGIMIVLINFYKFVFKSRGST